MMHCHPNLRCLLALAALPLAAAGCTGEVGTLSLSLITAPGSTVMEPVTRARLTLSNPETVIEADRNPDGSINLELDVVADGFAGYLSFEGFDADGDVVAYGRTGPVPIAAIDAEVIVYVAAPLSFSLAPVENPSARTEQGVAPISYGVVLAGGVDAADMPLADLSIYNVYDHSLQVGEPMPAPRRAPTLVAGDVGNVYLFGGADETDTARSEAWRFDTNAAPRGRYDSLMSSPDLARIGARAVSLFDESFLVAGDPVAIIDGVVGRIDVPAGAPASVGEMTAILDRGFARAVIVGAEASAAGAMGYTAAGFEPLQVPPATARDGHGAVLLRDGDTLVIGGATAGGLESSGVRLDLVSDTYTVIDGILPSPRRDAAIAATPNYLVLAGGVDQADQVLADAVIIDMATLAVVATVPLSEARTGATAVALANGQVLVTGGRGFDGAPLATIELFTPAP